MFATLSEENRIMLGCTELPCTPTSFLPALLALDHDAPSVSDTALPKALRGNGRLSPEKYKAILDKLAECKALKESVGGLPIAFTNAQLIHGLLMERRRLRREQTPAPKLYSIMIGDFWFVERNAVGQALTTFACMMAPKMTLEVAERVLAELEKKHENVQIKENPTIGSGTSFARLMGLPEEQIDPASISAEYQAQ